MRVRWAPGAITSASRYIRDQDGMRAITAAVDALAEDPMPAEAFHAGRYHRLRAGSYRVMYVIDGDVVTVERAGRVR